MKYQVIAKKRKSDEMLNIGKSQPNIILAQTVRDGTLAGWGSKYFKKYFTWIKIIEVKK